VAGLYVTLQGASKHRLDAVAEYMRFDSEVERSFIFPSGFGYVWLSHDDEKKFSPGHDPDTGVHVIVGGRTSWTIDDWQRAQMLPYKGGLASRLILERYLNKKKEVTPYNGAAVIIIWDPQQNEVHLWTDQFGYHPVFLYKQDEISQCVICTFPDDLLKDEQADTTLDLTSMAEFISAWRVTPPNTYYKHLKYAGAASHCCWKIKLGSNTKSEYWKPFRKSFYKNKSIASKELAKAILTSIGERTATVSSCAFFISGGADSRVLLYSSNDRSKVAGINLYERPTLESKTAESLCMISGSKYIGIQRDSDYYPRLHMDNTRWSGGMWSTEDSHYLGVYSQVMETGAELVMSACTTDWLFKGYGLEKDCYRLFGKCLPINRFVNKRVDAFLPNYREQVPVEYTENIKQRFDSWFAGTPIKLQSDKDRLEVEDRRIRPACYAVSVSGQTMYRVYPYDTFLADSRIAECYARIPAKWKLNGEVWGMAATLVCEGAEDVVDSNYGWALDAGMFKKLVVFTKGWLIRKMSKKTSEETEMDDGHPPSYASWPEYGWYARNSETLKRLWESATLEQRRRMTLVCGFDPWRDRLEDWSSQPNKLFRILTLLAHWKIIDSETSKSR